MTRSFDEGHWFEVSYSHGSSLMPTESDDTHKVLAELRLASEDEPARVVGKLEIVILRPWLTEQHGESIYDLADGVSADWGDCAGKLYNEHGDLHDELGGDGGRDVLYLHKMTLLPDYQRRNLGLHFLEHAIRTFGSSCAVAALHPSPTQRRGARKLAQGRLAAYWEQLGFSELGRTGVYTRDLSMRAPRVPPIRARRRPTSSPVRQTGMRKK